MRPDLSEAEESQLLGERAKMASGRENSAESFKPSILKRIGDLVASTKHVISAVLSPKKAVFAVLAYFKSPSSQKNPEISVQNIEIAIDESFEEPTIPEETVPDGPFKEGEQAWEKKMKLMKEKYDRMMKALSEKMGRRMNLDPELQELAEERLEQLRHAEVFEHGSWPQDHQCAENIMNEDFRSAEEAMQKYINSDTHRPNMLGHESFGSAFAWVYDQREKRHRIANVTLFRKPYLQKNYSRFDLKLKSSSKEDPIAALDVITPYLHALEKEAKEKGIEILEKTGYLTLSDQEGRKVLYIINDNPPSLGRCVISGDKKVLEDTVLFENVLQDFLSQKPEKDGAHQQEGEKAQHVFPEGPKTEEERVVADAISGLRQRSP